MVLVFIGGVLGGMTRYWLLENLPRPHALLLGNVLASFVLGLCVDSLFFGVGFAGALSTWASFAADVVEDFRARYKDVLITIPAVLVAAGMGLFLSQL